MALPSLVPVDAYRNRAANTRMPASHRMLAAALVDNVHNPETALRLASTSANYFADVSEYQQPLNAQYAYPIRMFRCDSGYREDSNCAENWADTERALNDGSCRVAFIYPVFVPGGNAGIMARIRNRFGSTSPTSRLAAVVDMESNSSFAGPGDHSAEANDLCLLLADYTGEPVELIRSHAYGNMGDYAQCWPGILPNILQHRANYGGGNPGGFAWQYQGGNPAYPAPVGAPRSFAPFGTYVDGNVIYQTLDVIEQQLGIVPTSTGDDEMGNRPTMYRQRQAGEDQFGAVFVDIGGGLVKSIAANDYGPLQDTVNGPGWDDREIDAGLWNVVRNYLTVVEPGQDPAAVANAVVAALKASQPQLDVDALKADIAAAVHAGMTGLSVITTIQ